MKKNLFTGISGIFLFLVTSYAANAQLSFKPEVLREDASFETLVSKNVSVEVEARNVNRKAVKDFTRNFKNVSDEKWYKVQNEFIAAFILSNINYQVAYNKKGNRLYSIRTYDEAKLPSDIRHIVKSTYYDYNITLVQEIERPASTLTYVVHLEGKTNWINLRVSNGEMEDWQKFVKSK